MDNETIRQLQEAVALSPENVPLRLHLAEVLLKAKRYADAATHFGEVLARSYGNLRAKTGLAEAYFYQQKYSAALIIFEEVQDSMPVPSMVLYVKCLLKENSRQQAVDVYQRVIALHPEFRDEEIDQQLRLSGSGISGDGYEEEDDDFASSNTDSKYFLERPDVKFSDVGGMKRIKEEIAMKIIQPLRNPDLYKAFGKKTGGGILLYGPPGCGKTFIAKATAGEIDAKFISIGLHDILDMWIGNSEKNLHGIFELARKNAPCVLFFDEVDAMGASRNDMKQSAMRHVINQFLAEMDGVNSNNEGVLILAATNAPWSVDPAFRRPGRFDRVIFVEPPDETAREEILAGMLKNKPVQDIDIRKIAKETNDYSGADLQAVLDIAVEDKLRESLNSGVLQPIGTKDLLRGVKAHRPTTLEWFASARNYALYANESGLYDDILKFLKIKK